MQVNTWNKSFNDAANACHLSVEDILALDDGELIGDYCWLCYGEKIQVAIGNGIWTVELKDLLEKNQGTV
jgi:hypothetical protein